MATQRSQLVTADVIGSQSTAADVVLSNEHIRLRPIEPRDMESLYRLVLSEEFLFRWRYRGATPSPDDFGRDLWKDILAQFVVEQITNATPVGMVSAYHANHKNQTVYLSVIAAPRFQRSGAMMMATELFVGYLFQNWNFRKIYAEVLEFNLPQFASAFGVTGPFAEEGRLREFEFYDGRFWDLIICSVDRKGWLKGTDSFHGRSGTLKRGMRNDLLDEATFCKMISENLVVHPLGPVPGLDDDLVDDLGFDSLDMFQLLDILERLQGRLIDEKVLSGLRTVRDWYLLYVEALQMPSESDSR